MGIRPHCQTERKSFLLSAVLLVPPSTHNHLPTFQTSWYMIRKATGSANSGRGLNGHSIHVGILINPHQTAQRLGSALLFQCPRLPGPSALWQDNTLPLSWKHQVKLVRSFTNHSLCPSNSQTLLSSPGQKVRLKS